MRPGTYPLEDGDTAVERSTADNAIHPDAERHMARRAVAELIMKAVETSSADEVAA